MICHQFINFSIKTQTPMTEMPQTALLGVELSSPVIASLLAVGGVITTLLLYFHLACHRQFNLLREEVKKLTKLYQVCFQQQSKAQNKGLLHKIKVLSLRKQDLPKGSQQQNLELVEKQLDQIEILLTEHSKISPLKPARGQGIRDNQGLLKKFHSIIRGLYFLIGEYEINLKCSESSSCLLYKARSCKIFEGLIAAAQQLQSIFDSIQESQNIKKSQNPIQQIQSIHRFLVLRAGNHTQALESISFIQNNSKLEENSQGQAYLQQSKEALVGSKSTVVVYSENHENAQSSEIKIVKAEKKVGFDRTKFLGDLDRLMSKRVLMRLAELQEENAKSQEIEQVLRQQLQQGDISRKSVENSNDENKY